MPDIQIMPSILAADWGRLAEECQRVETAGAEQLHVDVMDGVFVPNISYGPDAVRVAVANVKIPRNVHLMLQQPQNYVKAFADAGSDSILIHIEAKCDVKETLAEIRKMGKRAGITLNPETPAETIFECIENRWIDEVLVMSVHPGFGGQKYLAHVEDKIKTIRQKAEWLDITIDGGINDETVKSAAAAGANMFVSGAYLFNKEDMKAAIDDLRKTAADNFCKAL